MVDEIRYAEESSEVTCSVERGEKEFEEANKQRGETNENINEDDVDEGDMDESTDLSTSSEEEDDEACTRGQHTPLELPAEEDDELYRDVEM